MPAALFFILRYNYIPQSFKPGEVTAETVNKDDFNEMQSGIHAADARLREISTLQKHIGAYGKTKNIYAEYKKQKYSKNFFAENEAAINSCKAAKAYFNELKLDKLPTIKMLQTDYASIAAEKKKLYSFLKSSDGLRLTNLCEVSCSR